MRTITEIISVNDYMGKLGRYWRTYAIAGGDECVGYGRDFKVGDQVEVFFDDKWDVCKMQKAAPKAKINLDDIMES